MKRLKKVLAGVLALALVFSVTTAPAFAGILDEMKTGNNAMAVVMVENPDCEKLPEIGDLTVRISSAEAGIDISVPVQKMSGTDDYLCMWLGVPEERISDEMMKKLAEIQGKIDLQEIGDTLEDVEKLLNRFQVEVQGLPEGHYVSQGGALVITNEIYKQSIDIVRQALKEEGMEFNSFSELIEKMLADAGMTLDDLFDTSDMTEEDWADLADMGITKETMDQLKELVVNIDQVIDYLCSDEFTGVLIAGAYLTCDCPELSEFEIVHRYYEKVNGKMKLVGTVYEGEYDEVWGDYYIPAKSGDLVKASDYVNPVYKGKTYEYLGSYDSDVLLLEDWGESFKWSDYKMDSFVVDADDGMGTYGLVLRYVIDKGTTGGNGNGGNGGNGSGQTDPASGETAPKTGDDAPIGMYIALLITAIGAVGAAAAYRKTEKK